MALNLKPWEKREFDWVRDADPAPIPALQAREAHYGVTADTSVLAKSPPLKSSGSPVDWDSAKEKQSP